jgi:hypothetical protein
MKTGVCDLAGGGKWKLSQSESFGDRNIWIAISAGFDIHRVKEISKVNPDFLILQPAWMKITFMIFIK